MILSEKIAQLDSLERLELELEIDKKREKKKDAQFKRTVQDCLKAYADDVDKLIEAFDARYHRR